MGDMNRDLLNNQIKNAWLDDMEPFGLAQIVSEAQWISPEILAMKCRDRHKSIGNDDDYNCWRNKVIKMIQNAKKVQYKHSLKTIRTIQVVFIRYLRNLVQVNAQRDSQSLGL